MSVVAEEISTSVYGTYQAECMCCNTSTQKVMLSNSNRLIRRASSYLKKDLQEMLNRLLQGLPDNDVMKKVLLKEVSALSTDGAEVETGVEVGAADKKILIKSLVALLKYLDDFEAQKYSDGETAVRTRYFKG